MAASYPNAIKTFTTKTDNIDDVMAEDVNDKGVEITAIETELGTLPKGAHATVKARLEGHVHSGGDGGQVDHNTTANLTVGDVHTQYHNDARGDVRYAPIAKGVTNGDSHDHAGGDGAQIDHGGLAGLADDDHTHYHNDTRGDARYAPIAKGVTNGDSHDHSGGDGAQVNHTTLSNIGTNTHAQIYTHIADNSDPHGSTLYQTILSCPRIYPPYSGIDIPKNSAADIFGDSGMAVVRGDCPSVAAFIDLILFQSWGTKTIIASVTFNTPPGRTYSDNSGNTRLTLDNTGAAGTYNIYFSKIA